MKEEVTNRMAATSASEETNKGEKQVNQQKSEHRVPEETVAEAAPIQEAEHALPRELMEFQEEWASSTQLDPDEHDSNEYYRELELLEKLAAARAANLISAEQLVRQRHDERQFLIGPDLLPKRGRMLITGKSGTGKSALTLRMAACLASKNPLFGILHTHKGEDFEKPRFPISDASVVLYIDYELPDEIRAEKRLKPMMEFCPQEAWRNLFFPPHPSLYRLHNQLGESQGSGSFDAFAKLVENARPDVLIVDPLSSAHTIDENSSTMKQALNNIDRLIDLYGCTAIIVHHASTKVPLDANRKPIKKATIAEPRGHSCLVDWCDVLLHFESDDAESDEDGDDEEEAQKGDKIIEMRFGKTRYCRKPDKRRLKVNFDGMTVESVPKRHGKK